MIGYICSDLTVGKSAFFLKGQPNSGKSVIAEFIGRLFDEPLVSDVPLHELGGKFSRAQLAGKKSTSLVKLRTGRSVTSLSSNPSLAGTGSWGSLRGRTHSTSPPTCKLLFAGNTLPRTTEADTTAAFANRLVVLLFNQSIPPEQQDKSLLDKLWLESDSIVTLALHAMQ